MMLADRIENKLYYDDVAVYYYLTIMSEYTFVFEYVLIRDNLPFQKIVCFINFVII